jgi:tetratricopeptide (TPR) repeat protein
MWKDHPWFGVGPDHFDFRFRQYREPVDKTQGRPGRVHNDYLNTLVDYGAVGFLLLLLPIGVGVWAVVRCWPFLQRSSGDFNAKKSNRAGLVLGAAAGLIALLVHSFFDFNMHIPSNAFVAIVLLAILTTHFRFATERYWFTARWPLSVAASLALIGSLVYLVPKALVHSRAANLSRRADKLPDGSTNRIALLQQAFAVDPTNFETAYAVGEQLRSLAWTGDSEHRHRAAEAIPWFERAYELNKWDSTSRIQKAMCLDWLERYDEAVPFYQKGLELDPNYWYPHAMMGWHEFQLERYAEARRHMYRSLELLHGAPNSWPWIYLQLCDKLLAQQNARNNAPK